MRRRAHPHQQQWEDTLMKTKTPERGVHAASTSALIMELPTGLFVEVNLLTNAKIAL